MKFFRPFVILFLVSLFLTGCGHQEQAPTVATVGKPAPDFTLTDLDGKTWTLSELKGQVVFVNFWATWCPPCREEMPSMQQLYRVLPTSSFKMLAILYRDKPALARSFAAKAGLTMPILVDETNSVSPRYGITGVPETYIVDKDGILREKIIGGANWSSPAAIALMRKYLTP